MNKQSLIEKAVIDQRGSWKYESKNQILVCRKEAQEFSKGDFCYAHSDQITLDGKVKSDPYWELVCTREEFNATADRMRGKPDWKDAPEWAKWLAQDGNGSWWFYEVKVTHNGDSFVNPACRGNEKAAVGKVIGDWRKTLERRPEQKPEPVAKNWFDAGELPPVGTVCEILSSIGWVECEIKAHGNCRDNGKVAFWQASHDCGCYYTPTRFRPIKTDKEKAIEAAQQAIASAHLVVWNDTLLALYDAGLLRLPDQK